MEMASGEIWHVENAQPVLAEKIMAKLGQF